MADLFDYLHWRADVPFSADPFNEVDNLILCELAYADLRGIVPGGGTEVPLPAVCRLFFEKHTEEELLSARSYTAKAPILLKDMAEGARFRGASLCFHEAHFDKAQDLQFSATVFRLPDCTDFAAFRGTDGTLVGWKEDFNLSFLKETAAQKHAVSYVERVARTLRRPLLLGGHSKGGNLAVYAAALSAPDVREQIVTVYNNDGPGFRDELVESEAFLTLRPKIRKIVPDTSIIGLLLSEAPEQRIVKSSASGLQQHDGFTWQVQRNRFEDAELSDTSILIDRALGNWIAEMDDEARRSFTDTVFSLLSATGKDSLSEMGETKWKSFEKILSSARGLPREKQQELFKLVRRLISNSGNVAVDYLNDKIAAKYAAADAKKASAPEGGKES